MAQAQSLTVRETWDWPDPESLAWDAELCGLWIAGNGREAVLVTPDGVEETRISGDLIDITAITATTEGLLTVSNNGTAQWLSRDGTPMGDTFRLPLSDAEGITTMSGGRIYAVEDDPDRLSILTPQGGTYVTSMSVPTTSLLPEFNEPQGSAVDPNAGHLLIVDDEQGSDRLYILTSTGQIRTSLDLSPYGRDAEGVAYHPATGTLWVAFDSGDRIVVFDYLPSDGATAAPDHCVPSLS